MTEQLFIFLSHNSLGGIETYQSHQISYLNSIGKEVLLLEEESGAFNDSLVKKLKNPQLFNILQSPVWSNIAAIEDIIKEKSNHFSSIYIIINNPSLLIKNLLFIIKLRFSYKFQLILTLHSRMIFRLSFLNPIGEFLVSLIALLFFRRINYVSHYIRLYWESKFFWLKNSNSLVVNNGIEIQNLEKIRSPNTDIRIGFVGRLDPDKNPQLFIDIAKLALIKNLNFKFIMYGDGVLRANLLKSPLDNLSINFWQNPNEIYKSIDIILITSPIETSSYVLLEAKSFGIPVITCSKGGISELYLNGYDGIYVPSCRPKEFLLALGTVCANYQFYSSNCFSNLSSFNANKLSRKIWEEFINT